MQVNANRQLCADRIAVSMNSEMTAKRARRSLVNRAAMIYFVYVQPELATYEINIPAPILHQIQATLRYACVSACPDLMPKDFSVRLSWTIMTRCFFFLLLAHL